MIGDSHSSAALKLSWARLGGEKTAPLPDDVSPTDIKDGYKTQHELHKILMEAGYGPLGGHKIGCTTPVMQEYLGIDHPCAGRIFTATIHPTSVHLPLDAYHRVGVECEIAAKIGADLLGGGSAWTAETVRETVTALYPAIEIVDDRYVDFRSMPAATLIADDFFNAGAVLGAPVTEWRDLDLLSLPGRMSVDGEVVGEGKGADILGDPMAALAWLANLRLEQGRPLMSGEFVLLGSIVKTVHLDQPAAVSAEIDGLGTVSVQFY